MFDLSRPSPSTEYFDVSGLRTDPDLLDEGKGHPTTGLGVWEWTLERSGVLSTRGGSRPLGSLCPTAFDVVEHTEDDIR